MSYRKITVADVVYEYVIGKTFIKIRNGKQITLAKVADVGNRVVGSKVYQVTPATVASIIRKEPLPRVFECKRHNVQTTELVTDPYEYEIKDRKTKMINCRQCIDEAADNI